MFTKRELEVIYAAMVWNPDVEAINCDNDEFDAVLEKVQDLSCGDDADADLREAAEDEIRTACGRASFDCSHNPCVQVIADREA
jgi:hypothetical protein